MDPVLTIYCPSGNARRAVKARRTDRPSGFQSSPRATSRIGMTCCGDVPPSGGAGGEAEEAGSFWMTVQHTLFRAVATAGASTDLGALLVAAVVALLVQREER